MAINEIKSNTKNLFGKRWVWILLFLVVVACLAAAFWPHDKSEKADDYKIVIPNYTQKQIDKMTTEQKGELIYQYLATASIYLQLNQLEQAKGYYEVAMRISGGTNRQAIDKLGDIYFRMKKFDDAEKMYRLANERGERNLAVLLYVQKRYDELKPLLEKLATTHPDDLVIVEMAMALKVVTPDEDGEENIVVPLDDGK